MLELWRPVRGYESLYEVSNLGRVKRIGRAKGAKSGRILKPGKRGAGYPHVNLWKRNKAKTFHVHRLVALAFIPRTRNKNTVNHKNGVVDDNRVSNLEWVTHGENIRHAYTHLGRTKSGMHGSENPAAKLSKTEVLRIRSMFQKDPSLTFAGVGREFGVSETAISKIVKRSSWKNI